MKSPFFALALSLSLANSEVVAQTTIPGNIVACYKQAVNDLFEKPLNSTLVGQYVDPKEVIEYLRIPEEKQKDGLEEKVIRSVLNFANFVKKEIEKRQGSVSEGDLKFTFYKVYSTKIVVKGEIDTISFKVTLDPKQDCKILDFTLEGVKGMLDGVPKG